MRELVVKAMTKLMKLTVHLLLCWPQPQNATMLQVLRRNVARFLSVINAILMIATVLTCNLEQTSGMIEICYKCTSVFAAIYLISQTIMLAKYEDDFRTFISFVLETLKLAKPHENVILEGYIDHYGLYGVCVAVWFYVTAVLLAISDFIDGIQTSTKYAFSIENPIIIYLLGVQRSFCLLQCVAAQTSNVFVSSVFLFLSAKFDMLSVEFQRVNNVDEVILCIKKHQALMSYVNTSTMAASKMLLNFLIYCASTLCLSAIVLLTQQRFDVKIDFIFITFGIFVEVHAIAAPADCLTNSTQQLGSAAYNSSWYEKDVILQQYILHVMRRCQKPVVISISWFIPTLSLEYYGKIVPKTLSYFTFLRAVIPKDEQDSSFVL